MPDALKRMARALLRSLPPSNVPLEAFIWWPKCLRFVSFLQTFTGRLAVLFGRRLAIRDNRDLFLSRSPSVVRTISFFSGRRVIDTNRVRPLSPTELALREAAQRHSTNAHQPE